MTTRLYYSDAYARQFDAEVTACAPAADCFAVTLDATAFYPTSGGQPHDVGTLGGRTVVDVVDDDDGRLVHVVDGPLDVLPGLKRQVIPANEQLANFICQHGYEHGFDWAVARAFTVDHAVAIPDRLIVEPVRAQGQSIGTVPVYIAAGVDPFLRMKRAIELGGEIKAAVEAAPADERVVVIASGGISHWVGTPEMGKVNEAFDREIMAYACNGDLAGIGALSDEYILEKGGNGAMEIRQWAVAMGAMPGAKGEIIDYAPVREWVTGLGFVQLFA